LLAIIAGSAGHEVLQELGLTEAGLQTQPTPWGQSSPLAFTSLAGAGAVVMLRHGTGGYSVAAPFVNYRANVWALKERGVTEVIAWSGPGAIDATVSIGQYVIPEDVLDETTRRPGTFFEGTGLGVIRQNPTFCPRLRAALGDAGEAMGRGVRIGGTYVCTEGPRLETSAEIRKYQMLGADYVGMTLCPEVFLSHELELCYAAVLYVTNYAEGIRAMPVQPDRLFGGLMSTEEERAQREAVRGLPSLIRRAAELRATVGVECTCQQSMERYRKSGRIGDDWRQWTEFA
jgi:5'-methylthioadenosine phosphorylase